MLPEDPGRACLTRDISGPRCLSRYQDGELKLRFGSRWFLRRRRLVPRVPHRSSSPPGASWLSRPGCLPRLASQAPAPGAHRAPGGELSPRAGGGSLRGLWADSGEPGKPRAPKKGSKEQGSSERHRERESERELSFLSEAGGRLQPSLGEVETALSAASLPRCHRIRLPTRRRATPRAGAWTCGVGGPDGAGAAGSLRSEPNRSFQRFLPCCGADSLCQGRLCLGGAAKGHRAPTCLARPKR